MSVDVYRTTSLVKDEKAYIPYKNEINLFSESPSIDQWMPRTGNFNFVNSFIFYTNRTNVYMWFHCSSNYKNSSGSEVAPPHIDDTSSGRNDTIYFAFVPIENSEDYVKQLTSNDFTLTSTYPLHMCLSEITYAGTTRICYIYDGFTHGKLTSNKWYRCLVFHYALETYTDYPEIKLVLSGSYKNTYSNIHMRFF